MTLSRLVGGELMHHPFHVWHAAACVLHAATFRRRSPARFR